jgi:hypothetical protein
MEKPPAPPAKELPAWAQNELSIIYVKIALGGDFAKDGFRDYLRRCGLPGKTISVDEFVEVLTKCLKLEKVLKLKMIDDIMLVWAGRMASGVPQDYRVNALIAEWTWRQVHSRGPGRNTASILKKIAVRMAAIELAKTYPKARGAKKQMEYELQTKFGLKRSQLSELLSDFDPWEYKVSDKLDL